MKQKKGESQRGRHCRLLAHHPVSPSYRNPGPAEQLYCPVLVVLRQGAGQRDTSEKEGLGRAYKKEFRFSTCTLFALYPLRNTDEMLEVKRPLCDSKRVSMRTEAHGTGDSGSCPLPDFLLHRNTRKRRPRVSEVPSSVTCTRTSS